MRSGRCDCSRRFPRAANWRWPTRTSRNCGLGSSARPPSSGETARLRCERLGETGEILVHALNNAGTAELHAGRPEGREKLERSLAVALDAGLEEHVARAYLNLAFLSLHARRRQRRSVRRRRERLRKRARPRVIPLRRVRLEGTRRAVPRQMGCCTRGRAVRAGHPHVQARYRITPLMVVGLLHARRGDADPWGPLDEALDLACQPAAWGWSPRLAPKLTGSPARPSASRRRPPPRSSSRSRAATHGPPASCAVASSCGPRPRSNRRPPGTLRRRTGWRRARRRRNVDRPRVPLRGRARAGRRRRGRSAAALPSSSALAPRRRSRS